MFLKRLSTVLCVVMCLNGVVLGTTFGTTSTETEILEENLFFMAPLDVVPLLQATSPRCNGESNGYIDVQIETGSGTAPFSYRLQKDGGIIQDPVTNQPSSFRIDNLSSGTYRVYVTDRDGIQGDNIITITDFSKLNVSLVDPIIQPACAGETANISFQANGGDNSDYLYRLYRGTSLVESNNNGSFTGLGSGNYTLSVVDGNGCPSNYKGDINIQVPQIINFDYTILNEISCQDGFATVDFYNLPTDPFTIEIKNTDLINKTYTSHDGNYVYNNLEAGDYEVTVYRNSCPTTDRQTHTFTLDNFENVTVTANPPSPVVLECGGPTDLIPVEVTVDGGRPGRKVNVILEKSDGVPYYQESEVDYGQIAEFTGVSAGLYTIRWNDKLNPSCNGSMTYTITTPSSVIDFSGALVGISPTCSGDSDGTIQIPITGGTPPYRYFINGTPYNNLTDIQLLAGPYNVYVVDDNDCFTETMPVTIPGIPPLQANVVAGSITNVTCPEGNDGKFDVSVSGGNGTYFYDITGPVTRNGGNALALFEVGSLPAGTYDLTVRDQNGCSVEILDINISEPNTLEITTEFEDLVCPGTSTDIVVTAIGGSQPTYIYRLFEGETYIEKTGSGSVTFEDINSGNYTITVYSDINCVPVSEPIVIKPSPPIQVSNFTDSIMVKCAGTLATLNLSVQGKSPFYYEVNTSGNLFSFNDDVQISGLEGTIGGYPNSITIYDDNNCRRELFVKVYEPSALENTPPRVVDVTCKGKNDAIVMVSVSGGTPNYWATLDGKTASAVDGEITFNNMKAGTFTMDITDSKGCAIPGIEVIIEEPLELFVIEDEEITLIDCHGGMAEVILSTTGGWPDADVNVRVYGQGLDITEASGTTFELFGGSYTVEATSDYGCTAPTRNINIPQPDQLNLLATGTNITCNGADDGKITLTVTGGTGSYHYGLAGLGTASIPFSVDDNNQFVIEGNLPKDTYNVVVRDDNNCNSPVVDVFIDELPPIDFEIASVDSVHCYGGSNGRITVAQPSGGTGTYFYHIEGEGIQITQDSRTFSNLKAGEYTIRVTDSNDCPLVDNGIPVRVYQPAQIILNDAVVDSPVLCHNDANASILVSASGGEPFGLRYWVQSEELTTAKQESPLIEGLKAGEYTVFVSDPRERCVHEFTDKVTITNPAKVAIVYDEADDFEPMLCHNDVSNGNGAVIEVSATGGTGTYSYSLYEEDGLKIPNQPNSGRFTNLGLVSGTPDVATTTSYRIVVSDGNGCSDDMSFTVENPSRLRMQKTDETPIMCHNSVDGTMTLLVQGGTVTSGYTFKDHLNASLNYNVSKVSDNEFIISGLGNTGTVAAYNPIAIDNNGCETAPLLENIEFVNPDRVVIDQVILGEKLCWGDMNDTTIIIARGGTGKYYYSLDNGSSISSLTDSLFIGQAPGTKYPFVKDEHGCEATFASYEYEQPDPLEVEYEFIPIMCYDDDFGDMKLEIKGGTGNYYLSINNSNFDGFINEIPRASTDVTEYSLIDNDMGLSEQVTYRFYLRDENNCYVRNIPGVNSFTKQIADTIFQRPEKLVLTSLGQKSVHCRDENTGMIEFEGRGGTVYDYSGYKLTAYNLDRPGTTARSSVHGSKFVDKLFAGAHRVQLVDAHNCIAETRLEEYAFEWDTITVAYANEAIHLSISDIFDPLCDRTYDGAIEINVADYSEDGVTAYVDYWDYSLGKFFRHQRPDTIYSDPDYADNSNPQNLLYYTNAYRVSDFIGIGRYMITVEDNYTGCTASVDTVVYSIDGDDCPDINNYNVFTPHNNDEYYDNWVIHGSQHQKFTLQVYTSYGELVYKNQGISDYEGVKWNGLDNHGRPAPVGTYIYLLRKNEGTPRDTLINGNVTIIRSHGR